MWLLTDGAETELEIFWVALAHGIRKWHRTPLGTAAYGQCIKESVVLYECPMWEGILLNLEHWVHIFIEFGWGKQRVLQTLLLFTLCFWKSLCVILWMLTRTSSFSWNSIFKWKGNKKYWQVISGLGKFGYLGSICFQKARTVASRKTTSCAVLAVMTFWTWRQDRILRELERRLSR